jgi:Flp pilus assembly protein TadG
VRTALRPPAPPRQGGAALVEFALVAMIFFLLLLAIFEFGRLMFTWNSAVEATRRGARLAVVCDLDVPAIKTQMRSILPVVSDSDIQISYLPSGCDADSCESVTVRILPGGQTDAAFQYYIPFLNSAWKIPEFSTTLTRESLSTGSGADANPDCT